MLAKEHYLAIHEDFVANPTAENLRLLIEAAKDLAATTADEMMEARFNARSKGD